MSAARWRRLACVAGIAMLSGLALAVPSSTAKAVDPSVPVAFAPVRLLPIPAHIAAGCRRIQRQTGIRLLCPTLLPRATLTQIPGWPPARVSVRPIGDFADRRVAGVDIGYGAPYEGSGWRRHRWRNRPCCLLHFDVFRRAEGRRYVPEGARPATLGGRRGLLAEAREGAYFGTGIYWGNHVRFLWREDGVPWVATLHTFGEEETERLLGRLIESLRPVDRLPQGGAGAIPLGATRARSSLAVGTSGSLRLATSTVNSEGLFPASIRQLGVW